MSRTGARIIEIILAAVKLAQRTNGVIKKSNFLWPTRLLPVDLSSLPVRVPSERVDESFRDVEHVAPEEIQRTMLLIIEHALGIKTEALFQETARILGFQRTGDRIREALIKNLRVLLHGGMIYQNDDRISMRPS
jgi:hypothetical protein